MSIKNKINQYLIILSDFDNKLQQKIESDLIDFLANNGTKESRYRNIKYGVVSPTLKEGVLLLNFLQDQFDKSIREAQPDRKETLEKHYPISLLHLYHSLYEPDKKLSASVA